MTQPGSAYTIAKRAIIDVLKVRPGLAGVTVAYDPPVKASDIMGEAGSGERISFAEGNWDSPVDGVQENEVICSLPLRISEVFTIPVVIQVIRPSSTSSEEVDRRVDELAGEVMTAVATDPTLGVGSLNRFEIPRASSTRRWSGFLSDGAQGRAAGGVWELEVFARIAY